jgi:hypothetical protein
MHTIVNLSGVTSISTDEFEAPAAEIDASDSVNTSVVNPDDKKHQKHDAMQTNMSVLHRN